VKWDIRIPLHLCDQIPAMKQISEHLWQIGLGMVNAFLIEDASGLTLIDTGFKNSTARILKQIEQQGKHPGDIRRIILSHAHSDHAGSAAELKQRLNVPVLAHKADADLMREGRAGRMPMQASPGLMNWIINQAFIKRADSTITPVETDTFLNDSEVLPIGGGLRVLHTPGHSAGHLSFLLEQDKALIVADACANMMGPAFSIVYEDTALGLQSIRKLLDDDFDKAVFGHGNAILHQAADRMRKKFQ